MWLCGVHHCVRLERERKSAPGVANQRELSLPRTIFLGAEGQELMLGMAVLHADRNRFPLQGIDIKAGGRVTKNARRTAPKSDNAYLKLLVKVCNNSWLTSECTDTPFFFCLRCRCFPDMGGLTVVVFLLQLYRFLERRTDSSFNKIVLKRMFMSKMHRPPLSLSKLAQFMEGKVPRNTPPPPPPPPSRFLLFGFLLLSFPPCQVPSS